MRFQRTIIYTATNILFLVSLIIFVYKGKCSASQKATDLTELTLEELMNIEITSVSRKPEKLSDAASAVYVVTQEEIRRSGATSIPELLRMVPGVQVAHITSSKWAISARGFSDLFAKFLKVLIDGRDVYSPSFGRVNWDEVGTMLEDIERIEVIRGPGATMWGANAVNGVINIITKKAKDTQGGLISFGGGNEEEGFGSVRYGGRLGNNVYYRTYIKYFNRDSFRDRPGEDSSDRWQVGRGGFRIDWEKSADDTLTLQGDVYDGDLHEMLAASSLFPQHLKTFRDTLDISGNNIITCWNHIFSDTSDMKLQLYYDRMHRDDAHFREELNIVNLDFQHKFALGEYQEIIWGLEYNFSNEEFRDSFVVSRDPDDHDLNVFSVFMQDEIELIRDLFT